MTGELTPPPYDGWKEKEKADALVQEAKDRQLQWMDCADTCEGYLVGEVYRQQQIRWYDEVIIRCEEIREKIYNEYR